MTNIQFFEESLKLVESESIRNWASSDHNKPLWLQICQNALDNGKRNTELMAIYIVVTAIGL